MQKISPCLWFDGNAEEAVDFYVSVFKDARKGAVSYYPDVGQETHGREAGSVLTVEFMLLGQSYLAMNGGPAFKFNEAISLMITCKDQKEIDYYWEKLGAGGDSAAQQCGWLKDKYGLSWQVTPEIMIEILTDKSPAKMKAAFMAMMDMKKMDIAALEKAYNEA